VHSALRDVFDIREIRPQIVYRDGEPFDVIPFPLEVYKGLEARSFERFSDALDEFFVAEPEMPKLSALERRLELQRAAIDELRAKETQLASMGDFIYQRYSEIDSILKAIAGARERGLSYTDIWERIQSSGKSAVKSLDYSGEMIVEIDGVTLELNAGLTVPQNAGRYYERAKEAAKKAAGAEEALRRTEDLLQRGEERRRSPVLKRRHKPRWFERFRWFYSSDDFLVIGGRDADGNEEIYLKYLEKRDLALHTDYPGAPLTVIKTEGREVPERTVEEAAQFAVSYSNLWREGVASGDCYVVRGDQVTKTPEHGEFLRKGAFVVRGERRYLRDVPLGVALAIADGSLIGGPVSAVRSKSSEAIELEPGEYMPDDLAKMIYRQLLEICEDRRYLKAIASPDKIVAFLPPGGSRIRRFDVRKIGV
jgi:Predicted RNA-binding protein homologous to eukaryotic snRNP